jgi:hypothetical protein
VPHPTNPSAVVAVPIAAAELAQVPPTGTVAIILITIEVGAIF